MTYLLIICEQQTLLSTLKLIANYTNKQFCFFLFLIYQEHSSVQYTVS